MTTQCIKVSELTAYVESAGFQQAANIPISRIRAIAQAANPRANANDVALVLIHENEKLIGYLGLLPDHINFRAKPESVAWMSCIWVSPDARGKGVARQLLTTGVEAWKGRLLATEFTAPAKQLYDKMNLFDPLIDKKGLRAYLKMNMAELMPKKNPKLKILKLPLRLFDGFANLLLKMRFLFYPRLKTPNIQTRQLATLEEKTYDFMASFQKKELCRRDRKDFDWILQYLWIDNSEQSKADAQRYHFSVYAEKFQISILEIFDQGELIGVLILSERDGHLKIPYSFFEHEHLGIIANVICDLMLDKKMKMLTIYQDWLVEYLKNNLTPFFHTRDFLRQYLIGKSLDEAYRMERIILQDGDGDCVFT